MLPKEDITDIARLNENARLSPLAFLDKAHQVTRNSIETAIHKQKQADVERRKHWDEVFRYASATTVAILRIPSDTDAVKSICDRLAKNIRSTDTIQVLGEDKLGYRQIGVSFPKALTEDAMTALRRAQCSWFSIAIDQYDSRYCGDLSVEDMFRSSLTKIS